MRVLAHIAPARMEISKIVHDSRFWAIVGLIAFIGIFTALVIWAAQTGTPTTTPTYYWPYGPGPYPVPMR